MSLMSVYTVVYEQPPPPPPQFKKKVEEGAVWYQGIWNQSTAVSFTFYLPHTLKNMRIDGSSCRFILSIQELPGRSCWSWWDFALMVKTAKKVPSKKQRHWFRLILYSFTADWLESNGCEPPVSQGSIWCSPWHEWMKPKPYCGDCDAK